MIKIAAESRRAAYPRTKRETWAADVLYRIKGFRTRLIKAGAGVRSGAGDYAVAPLQHTLPFHPNCPVRCHPARCLKPP